MLEEKIKLCKWSPRQLREKTSHYPALATFTLEVRAGTLGTGGAALFRHHCTSSQVDSARTTVSQVDSVHALVSPGDSVGTVVSQEACGGRGG